MNGINFCKRHLRLVAILALSSLVVLGCKLKWNVVFINGTDQQLKVELSGALDGSQRSFSLEPGHSHSELLERANRISVFDDNGAVLFSREDFRGDLPQRFPAEGHRVYVLLTETNAYPMPPGYKTSWRDHLPEITGSK